MKKKTTKKSRDKVRKRRTAAVRREMLWNRAPVKVKEAISKFVKQSKKQFKTIKKQKRENNRYNWK